jgi:hypothetical protein
MGLVRVADHRLRRGAGDDAAALADFGVMSATASS